jgi:rare lipoprotein A
MNLFARGSSLITILLLASLVSAGGFRQVGLAVYYPGRPDTQTRMTAAHRTLPKGSWVTVTHTRTGKSVKINDRGPWDSKARIIDLSRYAATRLGILSEGVAPVTLELSR